MSEKHGRTVLVRIFGVEYPIRADVDEEYVRWVARYVDDKMREVATDMPLRSAAKVAVLAAMHIVDELFQEREVHRNVLSYVQERTGRLIERLRRITAQE
ncbi:MAG TPA: cell division protein ZapA [Candidatus Latescibacteria bacterium]|nr:cell division protein ZapA [Candidatus Latescibacterota bacterium]